MEKAIIRVVRNLGIQGTKWTLEAVGRDMSMDAAPMQDLGAFALEGHLALLIPP